jgi:hypothetical protein
MKETLGDKDGTTLGKDVFFIAQPELDLAAQIVRVFRVASQKADVFVIIIVGMNDTGAALV